MINDIWTLVDLLLLALASWRLSFMLVNEEGNMSLTLAIRLLGMRPSDKDISRLSVWKNSLTKNTTVRMVATNNFGKMLECIWCTSVFVGLAYYIAYVVLSHTLVFQVITVGLALSALQLYYHHKAIGA